MQRYILAIRDRAISTESDDATLVRTSRGVDEIAVRVYSPEWLEGFALSIALYVGGVLEEQPIALEEPSDAEWLAEGTVPVPSSILEHDGPLGVTIHGTNQDGDHIITERAFPLTVMREGDGIGADPQPNP